MKNVGLSRYIWIFTAALISIVVVLLLVVVATNFEPNGSVGLLEMLVASLLTGMLFAHHNGRIPTVEERRKLVWRSFAVSLVVALIPVVGFLVYLAIRFGMDDLMQGIEEIIQQLPLYIWAIIVLVSLGLTYVTLLLGYGFFTTSFSKQLLKKNVRKN